MTKIYCVSGPQGCGKTTLLNGLKLKNIPVDDFKVSRSVQKRLGWDSLSNVLSSFETMVTFQNEVISQKVKNDSFVQMTNHNNQMLVERGFADIYAYCSYWGEQLVTQNKCSEDEYHSFISVYKQKCLNFNKILYSGVIFIPRKQEIKFEQDLYRADEKSASVIQQKILNFYSETNTPILVIDSIPVEDRIKEVLHFLRS